MSERQRIQRTAEIAAVVFDLDGVLLDSEPLHFRAALHAFASEGKTLSIDEYRRSIGQGAVEAWTAWKDRHGLRAAVTDLMALDEHARLEEIRNGVVPIRAASALARRLHSGGTPLAIASSSTLETIAAELQAIGLSDVFAVRVSAVQVPCAKPAPDVYLRAAQVLGAQPRHCLAIEDSPVGVQAAKAAGMTCVAVPTDWTRAGDFRDADIVLESLSYLPLLIS